MSDGSGVVCSFGESESHKLPPRMRREEIAIGGANVRLRCGTGASAEHHLVAHKFAVVFAERAFNWMEFRICRVGAGGPFPDIAEKLRTVRSGWMEQAGFEEIPFDRLRGCGDFPFGLGRKSCAGPACVGVGLEVAEVADRFVGIDRLQAGTGKGQPVAVALFPIKRRW